jgi:hypothetical protein
MGFRRTCSTEPIIVGRVERVIGGRIVSYQQKLLKDRVELHLGTGCRMVGIGFGPSRQ